MKNIILNLLLVMAVFLSFSVSVIAETKFPTGKSASINVVQTESLPIAVSANTVSDDFVGVNVEIPNKSKTLERNGAIQTNNLATEPEVVKRE